MKGENTKMPREREELTPELRDFLEKENLEEDDHINVNNFDELYRNFQENATRLIRETLTLFLEGMSDQEIATKHHVTQEAIRVRFSSSIYKFFELGDSDDNRQMKRKLKKMFVKYKLDLIPQEERERLSKDPNFSSLLNLNSKIESIEQQVINAIKEDGALVRIKGIKGSGKTWLLEKVIIPAAKREGYLTVSLDFRKSPNLDNFELDKKLEQLLIWLCKQIQKELGLNLDFNKIWDKMDDPKSNATNYLEKIFAEIDSKILLIGLDELENIFNNPSISIDFCDLLRAWAEECNRGNTNSYLWKQVRIAVLHSREKYAKFDIDSSGLAGAGKYFELNDVYDENQIKALIIEKKLNWSQKNIDDLLQLVGGYPDLINQAFKRAKILNLTAEDLIQKAHTDEGIYADDLRLLMVTLNNKPNLKQAFKTVIESSSPVKISDPLHIFHLESMGLVKLNGDKVSPRCELYRKYFASRIQND